MHSCRLCAKQRSPDQLDLATAETEVPAVVSNDKSRDVAGQTPLFDPVSEKLNYVLSSMLLRHWFAGEGVCVLRKVAIHHVGRNTHVAATGPRCPPIHS